MASNPRSTASEALRLPLRAPLHVARRLHALVAVADRRLPRGITHLCLQFLIWIGFFFAYNVTRGLADRNATAAFANGRAIADIEARTGTLFEPALQRIFDMPVMTTLMSYTYWLSQFVVVAVVLFWIYLRRHTYFAFLRNWLIVANLIGLVAYVLLPTAPPRMLPSLGFTDTLAASGPIDHGTVAPLANPFAAMPSLHAMDAFIVGVTMLAVARRRMIGLVWLLWPAWVAFAVLATANHYWLDIAAGVVIAVLTALALRRSRRSA